MITLPLYTFPEPDNEEAATPAPKDPWDIHVELVQAVRILEKLNKGNDRAAILNQRDVVRTLRAQHMSAVLGSFVK